LRLCDLGWDGVPQMPGMEMRYRHSAIGAFSQLVPMHENSAQFTRESKACRERFRLREKFMACCE
jgi:hypothetical protein